MQDHDIFKKRLGADGKPINHIGDKHKVGPEIRDPDANETLGCGSCYGAQSPEQECCNTCDEVLMTSPSLMKNPNAACNKGENRSAVTSVMRCSWVLNVFCVIHEHMSSVC